MKTFEVTATDGAGQNTTQTIHVTVAQNGGDGNGGGNGGGTGTGTGTGDGLDDQNVYGGCDATGGGAGGLLALIAFASLLRRRRAI